VPWNLEKKDRLKGNRCYIWLNATRLIHRTLGKIYFGQYVAYIDDIGGILVKYVRKYKGAQYSANIICIGAVLSMYWDCVNSDFNNFQASSSFKISFHGSCGL
jgi:hypothetical protein